MTGKGVHRIVEGRKGRRRDDDVIVVRNRLIEGREQGRRDGVVVGTSGHVGGRLEGRLVQRRSAIDILGWPGYGSQ